MAFTRTLPVTASEVESTREPQALLAPRAMTEQPAIAQQPVIAAQSAMPQPPAATEQPLDARGMAASVPDSSPATTTDAPQAPPRAAATRQRLRTPRLFGIALGAVVGFGAAAFFSYRGSQTPATAALPSAPAKTSTLAAAKPATVAPEPAREAPALLALAAPQSAVDDAAAQKPAAAGAALLLVSTVPSCQQLLGSEYVEKRELAAAFAQTQIGQRELVRGNVVGTQQAFCKAALWDNTNAERWLNLAQLFLIRRDGAKAAQCAQMVLTLEPSNLRGRTMLGDAWAMLGSIKEARDAYLLAGERAEPDTAGLQLMIRRDLEEAQRLVKLRDFVHAERLFRRVLVFDSAHAEASAGLTASLTKLRASHSPK